MPKKLIEKKIKTNINKKGVESVKIKLPTDVRMIIDRFEKKTVFFRICGGRLCA